MHNEEISELKRAFYKELDALKRSQQSFKKRTSVLANLFIPGLGFILYGTGLLKGLLSFILFAGYNLLFFNILLPMTHLGVLYYMPAVIIWAVSAYLVAELED